MAQGATTGSVANRASGAGSLAISVAALGNAVANTVTATIADSDVTAGGDVSVWAEDIAPSVIPDWMLSDDRQVELRGECRRLRDEPVVVGQQVVRQLDEETAGRRPVAAAEDADVALGRRASAGPITDPQPASDLAVAAAGQRDDALVLDLEELVAELWHGLRPGQVGV